VYIHRTIFDENPIGDTESGLLTVPARQAFTMSFGQSRDQFPSLEIDPLVDGLMADGDRMVFVSETSGDLLRRPTSLEVDPDIVPQEKGFEARATMALLPAVISLRLGLVRQPGDPALL
jgi:hypothetical protein